MIQTKLLAALAIFLALTGVMGGTYYAGYRSGANAVQKVFDAYKIEIADKTNAELLRIKKESDALQTAADTDRKRLQVALRDASISHDELVKRLQSRPTRPSGTDSVSASSGQGINTAGATGAQLYKEDGRFLAGEAARADKLRAYLQTCEADYERVKAAVNK